MDIGQQAKGHVSSCTTPHRADNHTSILHWLLAALHTLTCQSVALAEGNSNDSWFSIPFYFTQTKYFFWIIERKRTKCCSVFSILHLLGTFIADQVVCFIYFVLCILFANDTSFFSTYAIQTNKNISPFTTLMRQCQLF